jgi:outer membrane receptor for ferrienterochelin and colicins
LKQNQVEYASNVPGSTAVLWNSVDWALYGQDEFTIDSNLALSAGIRYDHYPNFSGTTNPRLGLIYHVWRPTTLKLLYGTAFRAPEPFEIYPDYGPFYDDNPKLQPETIRSVEGVAEQSLGQHFTLSGSVFRNWIHSLITIETNPSDDQAIYENAQAAHATGTEIELDGQFANGVQGSASYSYTFCDQPGMGTALPNSPEHLAKVNLSVPVWRERLFASVDAQYTSTVQTLAGNTLGGFPVFNATLYGHTLGKHLDISGSVYNLFDKRYSDPARPEDPEDSILQDGTTFRLKIVAKF